MSIRALIAILAGLVAGPALAAEQGPASLRALLVEYRCPVVDRLDRIYEAGDPKSDLDRFIAITVTGHPHGYVQCIFHDERTQMLCEASSGFYYDKPGGPRAFRQPAEAIAALGRLGFSADDSGGNFGIDFDVAQPPDFNAIADFMLKALHDGYGARAEMELKFNAPFAPRPTSKCAPVS